MLDFVQAVGCKLLISISNCAGDHPNGGALDLTQAKKIFALSHDYGVDIDAAEFMNEPICWSFLARPRDIAPRTMRATRTDSVPGCAKTIRVACAWAPVRWAKARKPKALARALVR